MKVSLEITQDDINNGDKHSRNSCPTALALKRIFKTNDIQVGLSTLAIEYRFFKVPIVIYDFILKFDKGLEVKPFSAEINLEQQLTWNVYGESSLDSEEGH